MSLSTLERPAETTSGQSIEIRPLNAPLGAEVIGLDLSKALSDADFKRIHQAHLDHLVLVFRDLRITPEQQIAFSRRFGPLQIHVLNEVAGVKGHPELLIISNIKENDKPIGLGDAGRLWHSDLSYVEKPSLGSMLHAQILPSEGGDTLFADQYAAYEALPEATKQRIDGLKAEHWYLCKYEYFRSLAPWRPKLTQAQIDAVPPQLHPVVRVHPETGRKALFVSEHFTTRIVGLPEGEGKALLAELIAHSTKDEFVYRHQWRAHDMVFWDNRCTQHLAAGTPDHLPRKLYRTTIEGTATH